MLGKDTLLEILTDEQSNAGDILREHYTRVSLIRLGFGGLPDAGRNGGGLMPGCHHVAHAYARAFDVGVVDGEKIFITEVRRRFFGRFVSANVSRYDHSWNLVTVGRRKIIVDLFPNETCSMTPVFVTHPHPAYLEPRDGFAARGIRERLREGVEQERIERLADEFKRIVFS